MARTWAGDQATWVAQTDYIAWPVVEVQWGGGTGTKYYSFLGGSYGGETLEARLLSIANPKADLQKGPSHVPSSSQIVLSNQIEDPDSDTEIFDVVDSEDAGGHRVIIWYVYEDAAAKADWIELWRGVSLARCTRDFHTGTLALQCHDWGSANKGPVGELVSKDDFAYCSDAASGSIIPTCYGYVQKVPAVFVKGGGPVSELSSRLAYDGVYFTVPNNVPFGAGTIQVWVGAERMEGSFSGNKFSISGRPLTIQAGVTVKYQDTSNPYTVKLEGFTGNARSYVGQSLQMKVKDADGALLGDFQYRRIRTWETSGSDTLITLENPFSTSGPNGTDDIIETVPTFRTQLLYGMYVYHPGDTSTSFSGTITTSVQDHERGEIVRRASPDGAYIFVVNSAAVQSIERVYIGLAGGSAEEQYYCLPEGLYQSSISDNQFTSEFGGNVATVTFQMPPGLLPQIEGEQTDQVFVDLKGPEDAYGNLITNPAEVIDHLAQAQGIASADIDSAALSTAETARTNWKVAFAITKEKPLASALSDIAFQSFLAIDWSLGLRLVTLDNDFDYTHSVSDTLTDANTFEIQRALQGSDSTGIATEILADYRPEVKRENEDDIVQERLRETGDPITDYGLHQLHANVWAYPNRGPVKRLCYDLLFRYRYPLDILRVPAHFETLILEVGDFVGLSLTGTGINAIGWVRSISYNLRDNRIDYEIAVPPDDWFQTYDPPSAIYTDPPDKHFYEYDQGTPPILDNPPEPSDPSPAGSTGGSLFGEITVDNNDGTYTVQDQNGESHAGIQAYMMQGVNLFEGNGTDATNKYVMVHYDGDDWYIVGWRPIRTV